MIINSGPCVGGPWDGQIRSAGENRLVYPKVSTVKVPGGGQTPTDGGIYLFVNGSWVWKG
jgi:hypothetical protein